MLFTPSLSDIQTIYLTSYPLYKSDTLNHLQAKYKPYGIRYIIQYKNNTTKVTPTLLKESVKTTTFSLTFADRGSKGLRKRKDYGRTQNFFQRVATFYVTGGAILYHRAKRAYFWPCRQNYHFKPRGWRVGPRHPPEFASGIRMKKNHNLNVLK